MEIPQPSTHRNRLPIRQFSILIVCAFSLCALQTATAWAQSGPQRMRRPAQLPSGSSTLKGSVVYKDNLEPLKKVRLRVFTVADDEGGEVIVFANNRGEFRLENLAAGKYYVTLEGPGVAMQSGFGMKIPLPLSAIPRREDFEPIIPRHDAEFTVDGNNTVDLEIKIERGGKLTGKVLKANGAPASNVSISLVSRGEGAGPYTSRFSTSTDKDGAYQFDNLPSGDYVVSAAIEGVTNAAGIRERLRGETQIVTYHPAATMIRDAQTVHVDPGGTIGGVNINLLTRESFVVSGSVIRQRDGTPLAGTTVLLRNKESQLGGFLIPAMSQRTTRTDQDGRWSFSNVMEGSYVVTALAPLVRPGRSGDEPIDREQAYRQSRQRFLVAQQDIIVAGGNMNDLLLSITGSGSISGFVALDNGQALPPGLVVFVELVREGGLPGLPLPVRVQPDGSFSLSEVQGGEVFFSAALQNGSGFFVKTVSVDGNDPRRTPLQVSEGTVVGPVRITLSTEMGRVTGRVLADKNDPLADVVVLLAPVEAEKQQFRTSYFTARAGADGSYSLVVAPGEYYVLARHSDQLPGMMTDEFLRNATQNAARLTIAPSEQKRLDVRVP